MLLQRHVNTPSPLSTPASNPIHALHAPAALLTHHRLRLASPPHNQSTHGSQWTSAYTTLWSCRAEQWQARPQCISMAHRACCRYARSLTESPYMIIMTWSLCRCGHVQVRCVVGMRALQACWLPRYPYDPPAFLCACPLLCFCILRFLDRESACVQVMP